MKISNSFGGALFAFGLLMFVDSRIQQSEQYTVSQLGQIVRTSSDPAAQDMQQTYQTTKERESLNRFLFLMCAAGGASLACIREDKS